MLTTNISSNASLSTNIVKVECRSVCIICQKWIIYASAHKWITPDFSSEIVPMRSAELLFISFCSWKEHITTYLYTYWYWYWYWLLLLLLAKAKVLLDARKTTTTNQRQSSAIGLEIWTLDRCDGDELEEHITCSKDSGNIRWRCS